MTAIGEALEAIGVHVSSDDDERRMALEVTRGFKEHPDTALRFLERVGDRPLPALPPDEAAHLGHVAAQLGSEWYS